MVAVDESLYVLRLCRPSLSLTLKASKNRLPIEYDWVCGQALQGNMLHNDHT